MQKFTAVFEKNMEKHLQFNFSYDTLIAPPPNTAKNPKNAGFAPRIMHIIEKMAENARFDDGRARRFLPEEKGKDHEALR